MGVGEESEGISFITFTRNSASRIARLLKQVEGLVDEIIVIDGYSADDTVEIAKSYGATVYQRKPWGFVEPDRMFALRVAKYPWILYLDDDELLGPRLKRELRSLVLTAEEYGVVALATARYSLLDRKVALSPFFPDYQIRIFKKDKASYRGLIHELPEIRGNVYTLPLKYYIVHFVRWNWKKQLFYARIEALQYYRPRTRSRVPRTRSRVRDALYKLAPFSAIPLWMSLVTLNLIRGKTINLPGLA